MYFFGQRLHSAGNFTAAEAPRTDVNMTIRAVNDSLDALYIGLPRTIGTPVRVAHLNAERDTFAAKFTLCHLLHLLGIELNSLIIITEVFTKSKRNFKKL